jgi:hypothetical protein
MAENYAQDVIDAEEMIREAGELVSVSHTSASVADLEQPWKESVGAVVVWADIPICYIPSGSSEALMYGKGTDIPEGAQVALLPGNIAFTPELEMVVESASRGKLKIDKIIDILAPGSVVIMYTVRLVKL